MGGPTDDAAHDAFAGVAGDEGVGWWASAQVVAVGVDDESSADDAKGSGEAEVWVDDIDGRDAVLVRTDIAEIAEVAVGGSEAAVCAPGGVEVSAHGLASVAEITEFVDMESVEAGRETRDCSGYAEAVRALIDENGRVGDAVAPQKTDSVPHLFGNNFFFPREKRHVGEIILYQQSRTAATEADHALPGLQKLFSEF